MERRGAGDLNLRAPGGRKSQGALWGSREGGDSRVGGGGRRAGGGACGWSPAEAADRGPEGRTRAARGAGEAPARSRPGPHSLVPLQEAALGDGPHGRPWRLGARTRGAETQAQLLLQAAGQRREAVASPARPCAGLGARVTVFLVLKAPGRFLELIEILPVPVRRHRRPAQWRAPPRPARGSAPPQAPPRRKPRLASGPASSVQLPRGSAQAAQPWGSSLFLSLLPGDCGLRRMKNFNYVESLYIVSVTQEWLPSVRNWPKCD